MNSDDEIKTQIHKALDRFNQLVSTKNLEVVEDFTPSDEALLIGSEQGEIAAGRQEIEAFFQRVFARPATFSRECQRINAWYAENLAWFFADGQVILSSEKEIRRTPYRITGVLENRDGRWLWRLYHGAEPVAGV
jgi:ketosteroid isomerase-like protein